MGTGSGFAPTEEQEAAREVFVAGRDLALIAGAGTGKTSTLILMGAAVSKRGLYISFNRAIAQEAKKRFGRNVECRTAHAVAYRAVGAPYQQRVNASARMPAWQTARILRITRDVQVGTHRIATAHQARLVMDMIRKFCQSTDEQVMARHLAPQNGLDAAGQDYLARTLLPYATRAWQDISSPEGTLQFTHDHYLKIWALTKPVLAADFILLDEAQDTNPVVEAVFLAQQAQRVCVGDPAQQIYGWRNARDIMTGFPSEHLHLTQSFRFGPRIAEVANRWLRHAGFDMRLTGHGPNTSRVGGAPDPAAVLCRGNADAMAEVMAYLESGVPVALAGGGGALTKLAAAARDLKAGRRTSHHELFLFTSWGEVQDYVEHDKAGQDLKATVNLIDTYGHDTIITAIGRLAHEHSAHVTVSTAHKAKGREWDSVRVGAGFEPPPVDDTGAVGELNPAEARLIYVAVSRARTLLDPAGITWIDEHEKTMARSYGTVDGPPMIAFSLTRQLALPASPVARFMARHLPHTAGLQRGYRDQITQLPHPVQPIDVNYPDWSTLGHAIDYQLRLSFGGDLGLAVTAGVEILATTEHIPGAPAQPGRHALHIAGQELLAFVHDHLTHPGRHSTDDLARICFVAAFYEDIVRTGHVRRYSMLATATPATTLAALMAAVPPYAIVDLDAQLQLAQQPLAPFRALPAHAKICGPVFTGSSDIGGADADYILDGLLLDCKATKDPHKIGRDELHQLAGYLLLDYHDEYRINRVGLYLSRQGALITWNVHDFLRHLGSNIPLSQLRALFQRHLHAAAHDLKPNDPVSPDGIVHLVLANQRRHHK